MKLLRIFTNREALLLLLIGLQAGASLAFPPPAIPAARPRTPTAAALALRFTLAVAGLAVRRLGLEGGLGRRRLIYWQPELEKSRLGLKI